MEQAEHDISRNQKAKRFFGGHESLACRTEQQSSRVEAIFRPRAELNAFPIARFDRALDHNM